MKEDIVELDKNKIISKLSTYFVRSEFPIVAAYLFGSYAHHNQWADSDLDLALILDEPDRKKRLKMLPLIISEIQKELKFENVDLCLITDENRDLAFNAIKDAVTIFCKDESKRAKVEVDIWHSYFEMQEFDEILDRYLWTRIEARRMGTGGLDMLDKKSVTSRIRYIEESLTQLKEYRNLGFEEFCDDRRTMHAALYELQTCLEAMTDIAAHIIGALGLKKPTARSGAFRLLSEAHILNEDLSERLAQAVGLRNIIVHGYLEVGLERVFDAIQNQLGDIEEFCAAIKEKINEQK